jgi:hypothetical protein
MPVPTGFRKTVYPGLAIVRGEPEIRSGEKKWIIGAAANLIGTDAGRVEEARGAPLNAAGSFSMRSFA